MNCHSQIWTNAQLLEPVRQSWATGQSIQWIKVHDLPDFVYFNHEIHVNKGIGCSSCHGRVDEMPLMYEQNSLQMEWCLNCHRNPAVNLRPTAEIYNMAWSGPTSDRPLWCTTTGSNGPSAQAVSCVSTDPASQNPQIAQVDATQAIGHQQGGDSLQPGSLQRLESSSGDEDVMDTPVIAMPASYVKFTSQIDLGHYLMQQYHIRDANQLASCEVCHR
jgi:hypothetical protein